LGGALVKGRFEVNIAHISGSKTHKKRGQQQAAAEAAIPTMLDLENL
jgi:hypothetical protein